VPSETHSRGAFAWAALPSAPMLSAPLHSRHCTTLCESGKMADGPRDDGRLGRTHFSCGCDITAVSPAKRRAHGGPQTRDG